MDSFILLSRCILDSRVFANEKMLKVWIWCLCKASYKDRYLSVKIGKGNTDVKLIRGEFLFGRNKAEEDLNIDNSTVYKIIKKLEKLEMISVKSNNHYSIITICKYDSYQDPNSYQVTAREQPSNSQVATNGKPSNTNNTSNTDNTVKKDKTTDTSVAYLDKVISEIEALSVEDKQIWIRFEKWYQEQEFKQVVKIKDQLTPTQLKKLLEAYGASEIKATLTAMENYKKVANYNSVYLTLLTWLKKQTLKVA